MPNRSDVDRVERDLLRAQRLPARRRDRDVRRPVRAHRRRRSGRRGRSRRDAQRTLIARRAVGRALGDGGTPLARSARFAGFADALLAALAELEAGLLDPDDARRRRWRSCYAAYRRELDRLGLWDRDLLRRRACERLLGRSRRLARRARLRVRLRGPDRGGVVAARGARRAGRGRRLTALRAGPSGVRVAARDGRGSRRARRRPHPGAAARSSEYAAPALAHLERTLFEPAAAEPPPIGGAVRFLEGAGPARHARARRRRGARASARRHAGRGRSRLVVPSVERWRAPLETVFATLGIPYAIEGAAAARGDAARARAALAAPLRLGGRRPARAVRLPPLAVLGHRALERRLRRGPAARPRGRGARPRRGGDRAAPRGAARALRELRDAESPLDGVRALLGSMVALRLRPRRRRPSASTSRLDLRCVAAATRLLDELEGWERARRAARRRRRDRGARAGSRSRPAPRPSRAASPCST